MSRINRIGWWLMGYPLHWPWGKQVNFIGYRLRLLDMPRGS